MSGPRTGDGKAGVVGVGVVALLVLLMGWGVWSAVRPDIPPPTPDGPSQAEGPGAALEGPGQAPGAVTGENPAPGVDPSPTSTRDTDPLGLGMYTPGPERAAQPGDEEAARAALAAVVPVWASADLVEADAGRTWVASFESLPQVSTSFVNVSKGRFSQLWGGALQADSSTQGATIASADRLWDLGSESLWRVTIDRKVVSNRGVEALNHDERVMFDFLVDHHPDPMQVVYFSAPSEANESSDTYLREQ